MSESNNNTPVEVQVAQITSKQATITAIISALVALVTLLVGFIKVNSVQDEQKKVEKIIEEKNKINLYREIPTIIPSILDFQNFSNQFFEQPNPAHFTPSDKKFQWAPLDGRDVTKSHYHLITNKTKLPDLRGLFLRNVNSYGVDWLFRSDGATLFGQMVPL